MMPGSVMPKMINIEPYQQPTDEEIFMSGLSSVYLKGLPSYRGHVTPKDETPLLRLCVPTRLAANSFIGTYTPDSPLQGICYSTSRHFSPAETCNTKEGSDTGRKQRY
ncbi:hypothetical protein V8C35DRAFT_312097 [Trichoderma chlorosporum]